MMYDPLNTGIGSIQGDTSYLGGLTQQPLPGVSGFGSIEDALPFSTYPSPFEPGGGPGAMPSRPLPSEPGISPYPSPFGPGGPGPFPPFGGGTQGGIMDALNPHKRNLYSTYNPKKVDRFYKRVEQMSNRFFPGYTGGDGPQKIY